MGHALKFHIRFYIFQFASHSGNLFPSVQTGPVRTLPKACEIADLVISGADGLPFDAGETVVQKMRINHGLKRL